MYQRALCVTIALLGIPSALASAPLTLSHAPVPASPKLQALADQYARQLGFVSCSFPDQKVAALKMPNPYFGSYYSADTMYTEVLMSSARRNIDAEIDLDAENKVVTMLSNSLELEDMPNVETDFILTIIQVAENNILSLSCIPQLP